MQDNKSPESVPFIVFEATMSRMERQAKRLWVLLIGALIALVATNAAWIWYESQFETVSYEQEVQQDTEGGNNTFVGGDMYGETDGKNEG